LDAEEDYVTGVLYGADTLPLDVFARHLPFTSAAAFKLTSAILPAIMPVTAYLPGKFSHNFLSIDRNSENIEITLEGNRTSAAESHIFAARKRLTKFLNKCGAHYVPGSLKFSPPGGDAHLAGTVPMGGEGILSSSKFGELNIAKNVYVVDGSALPALPAKHCTFTIMANAHRIGKFLAET
jgi:choline dehydrogenase-like flavoprotein